MVEELHHIKWIAVAVSYVYYQEMGISYFESTLGRDFRQKQMWINACSGLMFDDEVARRSAAFLDITFIGCCGAGIAVTILLPLAGSGALNPVSGFTCGG